MAIIKRDKTITNTGEDVEKLELLDTIQWWSLWNSFVVL